MALLLDPTSQVERTKKDFAPRLESLAGKTVGLLDINKAKGERWLKTTVVRHSPDGPEFRYEEVDTSLIPPRPRTYGLKGAEVIEQVWSKMGAEQGGSAERAVAVGGAPK